MPGTATISRLAIQAAIKAKLESVAGIENVYTDYRRAADVTDFVNKFRTADTNYIHTWLIRRTASDPHTSESHKGQVTIGSVLHYYHTFPIEFFFAYQNETSEALFQSHIDDVLNAFSNQRTLGGWNTERPLALLGTQQDYLGPVYGHKALFTITVIDYQGGIIPQ